MRQATIVIPEDLEAEIETYLAAQGRQVDLSALVSDALRCYLADPQHANGHSAAPPARSAPDTSAIADDEAPEYDPLPIVIDGKEYWIKRPFDPQPLQEKDDLGEPDVSVNHDKYLSEP